MIESLADIEKCNINPVPQCENDSSYAQKITKALSSIDWNKTAFEVHNLVRGLQTWPCAQTTLNNKNIKIHKTVLSDIKGGKAGEIIDNNKSLLSVAVTEDVLKFLNFSLTVRNEWTLNRFWQETMLLSAQYWENDIYG